MKISDIVDSLFTVLFVMFLIFMFALPVYIVVDNFDLIVYGKITDLNEYINNISEYGDELPEHQTVRLSVNKCYGHFYTKTSIGRHSSSDYYYVIGLDDGSVMILDAEWYDRKDLDRMTEYTLSSNTPNVLVFEGGIGLETNGYITDKYREFIQDLKGRGIIPDDTKVRYSVINNGGGRGVIIFALVMILLFDFLIVKIFINYKQGKYSFNYSPERFKLNKPYDSIVKNKLVDKYHERFVYQIERDGYTYRTLEIADEVIEYYKTHEIDDIFIFVDYIMYPAEFCILQEQYKKAEEYLEHISARTFIDNFSDDRSTEFTPYKYWALKMEVIRGLSDGSANTKSIMDESEAEKLLREVEKYWDEDTHKDDNTHFWKDVCSYHYYMLRKEYSKAAECADQLITYSSNDKTSFIACILNADVMFHMKKREDSMIMMQLAKEKSQKNKSHVRQQYRKYMRKYGFSR